MILLSLSFLSEKNFSELLLFDSELIFNEDIISFESGFIIYKSFKESELENTLSFFMSFEIFQLEISGKETKDKQL